MGSFNMKVIPIFGFRYYFKIFYQCTLGQDNIGHRVDTYTMCHRAYQYIHYINSVSLTLCFATYQAFYTTVSLTTL